MGSSTATATDKIINGFGNHKYLEMQESHGREHAIDMGELSVVVVMSCFADWATEGVMQLVKTFDPEGERTIGVLTKVDHVKEKAVLRRVHELVSDNSLKLGYFVVRDRGADEDDLDVAKCRAKEEALFSQPEWDPISKRGRAGVPALKERLQLLLSEFAKREMPKQLEEVSSRKEACRKALRDMSPAGQDAAKQREYLLKIAQKFERCSRDAREGIYSKEGTRFQSDNMGLIARIASMNEMFSECMKKKGHAYSFNDEAISGEPLPFEEISPKVYDVFSDSERIKLDSTYGPNGDILSCIKMFHSQTRGPELSTVSSSLLARTFREQSKNWLNIARFHVLAVSSTIHEFFLQLTEKLSSPKVMRRLFKTVLETEFQFAYLRAYRHAQILVEVEWELPPSTYNHYFDENLQRVRMERLEEKLRGIATSIDATGDVVSLNLTLLRNLVGNKSIADHVQEDAHDILESYYKVARKRFVDNICRQVIDWDLLEATGSPLKIFTPELVLRMSETDLVVIATESDAEKAERARLESEIQRLEEAMEVLRS